MDQRKLTCPPIRNGEGVDRIQGRLQNFQTPLSSIMSTVAPPPAPASKKSLGTGSKVAIGCGIGCMGMVVLFIVGAFALSIWLYGKLDKGKAQMEEAGLTLAEGPKEQRLVVTEVPTTPTYYVADESIKFLFTEPVTVPIGGAAPLILFEGTYQDKVYARSMGISLARDSLFEKGLDVETWVIEDEGAKLNGEITGSYKSVVEEDVMEIP